MIQTVFNRYEKKYLMPESIYRELRARLVPYMQADAYGLHTICNIYYDTADDLLVRRSIEDPPYKEKLRLRSYGIPTLESKVFLEIKKKYNKVVNKRRIQLPLREAYDYLDHGRSPAQKTQVLKEIDFFLARYDLMPKLYLAYDRVALFGREDAQFRVTFDQNIRSRREQVRLESGDFGTPLLPPGWVLMESKVLGATPLWFTHILSDLSVYTTSFSKYGNVYRKEHGAFDLTQLMAHREENWENIGRKQAC